MGRAFRPPVERTHDGIVINLDASEVGLLRRLLSDLRELIVNEPENPALRRLFPVAYTSDDEAEEEYQRLMLPELLGSRVTALDTVDEVLTRGTLPDSATGAFMQSVNSLRLVLGTLLDVDEEHDIDDVDPAAPNAAEHQLYSFLSWLLDWTVRAAG